MFVVLLFTSPGGDTFMDLSPLILSFLSRPINPRQFAFLRLQNPQRDAEQWKPYGHRDENIFRRCVAPQSTQNLVEISLYATLSRHQVGKRRESSAFNHCLARWEVRLKLLVLPPPPHFRYQILHSP